MLTTILTLLLSFLAVLATAALMAIAAILNSIEEKIVGMRKAGTSECCSSKNCD